MSTTSHHHHPKRRLNTAIQYGALFITGLLTMAAPLLVLLAIFGPPGGSALVLAAILTLMLAAPVLMLTAYTPAVTVSEEAITLRPVIWRERVIPWAQVTAVKVYPLLPSQYEEVTRRVAVGRQNYRPADGVMLVIPGLPLQYHIVGFFAGERGKSAIALTNRAHTDYDTLLQAVLTYTDPAIHDDDLLET